jgi:short-subunit dehydrogenase
MDPIQGKYVLLTGGSRGLGPVIAESLVKRGAHLALTARSEGGLKQVAGSLKTDGCKIMVFPFDLAIEAQRLQLVQDVHQQFGAIDILVNNAGIETEGAYLNLSWADVKQTLEINLVAPMQLSYLLLPFMLKRKTGHIINICSIAAKSGSPYAAVYCATKAGLAEWTRAMRLELYGSGVHFSSIFPGFATEVGMFARFGIMPPFALGYCHPEQVAKAVVRAMEKRKLEIIVNNRPLALIFTLQELFPSFGDWIMRVTGVVDFQRRKVGDKSA